MSRADRSPVRVVIDCNGKQDVSHVADSLDWQRVCNELRAALAQGTRDNRCASAVVSVHFDDERCDHERPES